MSLTESRIKKALEFAPVLRNYSVVLLLYLIVLDEEGYGVRVKQSQIKKALNFGSHGLQLAIKDLERHSVLVRQGTREPLYLLFL